jgi:hypothetical protein
MAETEISRFIEGSHRPLKNERQAVSPGARRFGKRSPPEADEHLQKLCNAGSRCKAQFFNSLLNG